LVIAVDFDGTLCEDKFPRTGRPMYGVVNKLIERQKSGDKIVLWTCRAGEKLKQAVEYCRDLGLEFDGINDRPASDPDIYAEPSVTTRYRKMFADLYIDDRAMTPESFVLV
jgi:hypothetical protein